MSQSQKDLVIKFLEGLPCKNPDNFQKHQNKEPKDSVTKKPKSYISTKDSKGSCQLIVTDKTNILLRYLRQKTDRENYESKEKGSSPKVKNPSRNDEFVSPAKRPRRD